MMMPFLSIISHFIIPLLISLRHAIAITPLLLSLMPLRHYYFRAFAARCAPCGDTPLMPFPAATHDIFSPLRPLFAINSFRRVFARIRHFATPLFRCY